MKATPPRPEQGAGPRPVDRAADGGGTDARAASGPGPTEADLAEMFLLKYGEPSRRGWAPRLWARHGYFTPDDVYEALIAKILVEGCAWADVGCGRDIFPSNRALARRLADRCGVLLGVDPDDNLDENPYVHERFKGTVEALRTDRTFDVVSLRMVAEHITDPAATLEALARLTRPGGKVVIYTVDHLSPLAIAARVAPSGLRDALKRFLWNVDERDTFPVAYRMNSRRRLARLFGAHGFREAYFARLDDCRTFYRLRPLHRLELASRSLLRSAGMGYPEACLLGVYERSSS